MDMLQIPNTFLDLFDWFNSLNIEFRVLIAIIAILLSMVLIFIAFKLIEVFFLLLRVILDGILTIFRKSSKKKKKKSIYNKEFEKSEENDSLKQEKNEKDVEINSIDFGEDEEQRISKEKGKSKSKTIDPNNRSDNKEFIPKSSINLTQCPNCGKSFSQNSFSKIGDTLFVSCEECGRRYISNGEYFSENEE